MPQIINTNIPSLTAQRNLNESQGDVATALQRLSSGLRINSAKDDAAGLAISERFTAQIRGLNQAARNANDGISLAQTAEGSLAEVTNNLQRIRELAVQSANATNSSSDRQALQSEVAQLASEINRVAEQANFNGVQLLDGSFASQIFQVGANSGETVTVDSIADARTTALGSNTLAADGSITGAVVTATAATVTNGLTGETAGDNLTITTVDGGTSAPVVYAADSGADAIAAAINASGAAVGVSATATNSVEVSGLSAAGTVTFDLNGQSLSVAVTDQNDLTEVLNAINGVQDTTGVTASFTSDSSKGSITLSTTDGRNIELENFANDAVGNDTIVIGGSTLTEGGDISAVKTGSVELSSTQGAITIAGGAAAAEVFGALTSSFDSVAGLDISTVTGATSALGVIDDALTQVNSSRADLGAVQNRFESVVTSLQTTSENLDASRSRIRDADFAAETAALTRAQILQQAGISVLAQANAQPQNVLALLQ